MSVIAYRDRITGHYPISLPDLRGMVNAGFGEEPTEDILSMAGVDPVEATTPPAYDPATQTIAEGPITQDGPVWRQTWVVSDLPPPPVPASVSPLQFRRATRHLGLKTTFDAFVASLNEEGREAVEYATEFLRGDPLIEIARISLDWTPAQVDDVFRLAITL